jgi:hypothetical protein
LERPKPGQQRPDVLERLKLEQLMQPARPKLERPTLEPPTPVVLERPTLPGQPTLERPKPGRPKPDVPVQPTPLEQPRQESAQFSCIHPLFLSHSPSDDQN